MTGNRRAALWATITALTAGVAAFALTQDRAYRPDYTLRSGEEIAVIFVGGLFCGAHRSEGFAELIETMKRTLSERAALEGRAFSAIGVALDWKIDEGMEFLSKFGEFDEVIIGRNWLNSAAIRYIWRDEPGLPQIPQVIVLKRHLEVMDEGILVSDDQVLLRKNGVAAIREWIQAGSRL